MKINRNFDEAAFLKKCSPILLLVALLFSVTSTFAQLATLPMDFNGKHIFIKVGTGNSDTLRFVFDTGASNVSIDSTLAEKVGVSQQNRQQVGVGGHGGSQSYLIALNQTFRVAGLEVKGVNPVLVNFSPMRSSTGIQLDGLIGYELLNKYVTTVDFEKKKMSFYENIKGVDTTGYVGIPFEFNKNVLIPRFPVRITLATGEQFTGRVMFDSGGFFTLLVSTPYNKFHGLSGKLTDKILKHSSGLSAITTEERAVIKGMDFNGFSLGKMPIDLTVNDQAEAKDGYLGMIGIEIIQKFNLIIDYANKKIYMKPNKGYQVDFDLTPPVAKEEGNAESIALLKANKTKSGIKVTASGLQYQVLTKGQGALPTDHDRVTLYYQLYLTNGKKLWKPFDATGAWVHHLDKALPGMREAALMMPVGSKWKLWIPAALAFGKEGYEEVPPGETIICEMEVVAVTGG